MRLRAYLANVFQSLRRDRRPEPIAHPRLSLRRPGEQAASTGQLDREVWRAVVVAYAVFEITREWVILKIFFAHQRKTIKLSERSEGLRNLGDDRAAALIFRTDPVERVERANLIASCSGYFDRISLASIKSRSWGHQLLVEFSEHLGSAQLSYERSSRKQSSGLPKHKIRLVSFPSSLGSSSWKNLRLIWVPVS